MTDAEKTIRKRFSAAATRYEALAAVQMSAAGQLLEILKGLPTPSRILEVGCGTGILTRRLHALWPGAELEAIDIAAGMIEEASRQHAHLPGISWKVADGARYSPGSAFELITSNCALHWMNPFPQGIRNLADALRPGGRLVASIMLDGTLGELHEARLQAAPTKAPLSGMPTRSTMEQAMMDAGLNLVYTRTETCLTYSQSPQALLRTLHDQGLTGGQFSRGRAPLTQREFVRLEQYYREKFSQPDGMVRVTYEVGYFAGEKS